LFAAVVGVIWITVYIVVMLALYLSPLAIVSPCIVAQSDLPQKPLLLAHKGASAVCDNSMLMYVLFILAKVIYVIFYTSTIVSA